MNTLYLERSTGDCRSGDWVEKLNLDGVGRIVVGTGPGSFAGIRSAIAFAQGYALGRKCEVFGLPSACAVAASVYADNRLPAGECPLAVIGDSRRGMAWVALFSGFALAKEVFQVRQEELLSAVPSDCRVVTPDVQRIDELLKATFGERYLGGQLPTEEGLRLFAEENPDVLKAEPLPIYLNPAVRQLC